MPKQFLSIDQEGSLLEETIRRCQKLMKPEDLLLVTNQRYMHHVQNELGILGQAHQQMAKYGRDTKQSNEISVRLELQADFFAGVWAYNDNKMFGSLEDGDLQEALGTAQVIGDDYLQKKAQGYVVPESFNHGTSQQRMKWFKRGFDSGDIAQGNTFAYSYENL
jgi:predicted metalloprotease